MKRLLRNYRRTLLMMIFVLSITSGLRSQADVLVAEYKFETDQQGWTWQAYTAIGGTTTNPSGGWIAGVNWSPTGGTAGCLRHNISTIQGSWWAQSPALTFTAGKEYYVVFGSRLAGYTASTNQRVQCRIGTLATPNQGTIVLASTSFTSTNWSSYVEFTTGLFTAASTGTHYVKLADFYSNGSGWACYFDGVRIYEKYTAPANPPTCYRSVTSGAWEDIATWESRENCTGTWIAATTTPGSNSLGVTIQTGHTVTLATAVSSPAVVVETGAILMVTANGITITDGTGTDLVVDGTLQNNGGNITNGGGATAAINGVYIHNRDGGSLPTATWGSSSWCNITGMTANAPTNFGQVFANIMWNSPAQTGNPNLTGTNNPINVTGVFDYRSPNGTLDLSNINRVWTGDFNVYGVVALLRLSASGTTSLTVRNMDINDTYNPIARLILNNSSSFSSITTSLFITGNLTVNTSTPSNTVIGMNTFATPALPIALIDIAGNFTHTNGVITAAAASGGDLVQSVMRFSGAGVKNFVKTGGSYNNINWSIFSPAIVDFGNYVLDNIGNFTLTGGAGMMIGSQDGIAASGSTGTIRNTVGTRNFNSGTNFIYYNAYGTGVQSTGTGLPSSINNLTINNASGVTLSNASVTVNGILALESGVLDAGATNTVIVSNTGSVNRTTGWVAGNLNKPVSTGNPAVTFEVGTTTSYRPATLTFNGVSTAGSYTARVVPGAHPSFATGCFSPGNYVNHYWTLTNSGVAPANYAASFTYSAADYVGNITAADLKAGKYVSSWTYPTIAGTPNSTTLNTTGNSESGDYAIALALVDICYNGIDDDCDGLIDEDCIIPINDGPLNAIPIAVSGNSFPNCGVLTGDLNAATDSPQSAGFTGPDVWYRFTAQTNAVSITMSGFLQDNVIVLYDNSLAAMPGGDENIQGIGGVETLNYTGLTPGLQYYLSIGAVAAPASDFSLCLRHLNASFCADGSGTYQLCSNLKAQWTGATNYTYNFTPTGITGGVPTSITFSGQLPLSTVAVALRYGGTYTVRIDANYNSLTNGANQPEGPVTVLGIQTCNITIAPHAVMYTKATQLCPSTLLRGSILGGKPFICGATSFTIEFTRVTNCTGNITNGLPFEVTTVGGSSNQYLNFTSPQTLLPQSFYRVRWRPNFAYGPGDYGTTNVIFIGGAVMETIGDLETELANSQRSEGVTINTTLYPNPNKGELVNLNITDITSEQVFVRIMDSMGRVVYSNRYSADGSLNALITFTKPLATGLYLVEMTVDGEVITERMMVTR